MGRLLKLLLHRQQVRTITPEELHQRLQRGELIIVLDLRHPLDFLPDPRLIPGSIRISPNELGARHHEIPRRRDLVLHCTCPSESARQELTERLASFGITRVAFLAGGLAAWRDRGYPLVERAWGTRARTTGAA